MSRTTVTVAPAAASGEDASHHFRIASGSALEAQIALMVAVAWGHLPEDTVDATCELLDRIGAMLCRLAPSF